MSSVGGSAVGPKIYRLATWFDPEAAAVVTILLGLFQVLLSVPLAYADKTMPKLFILPLFLGILILAAGSFTMASERNPSRLLLQGCACSNAIGLLGTVLGFCLYCYSLSKIPKEKCLHTPTYSYYSYGWHQQCPNEALVAYNWSVSLLLLLYDIGAVVLHGILSVCALKALKTV